MTSPDPRRPYTEEEARLAAEIERLRLDLERDPDLLSPELRRRMDAITDRFLALYGAEGEAAAESR